MNHASLGAIAVEMKIGAASNAPPSKARGIRYDEQQQKLRQIDPEREARYAQEEGRAQSGTEIALQVREEIAHGLASDQAAGACSAMNAFTLSISGGNTATRCGRDSRSAYAA